MNARRRLILAGALCAVAPRIATAACPGPATRPQGEGPFYSRGSPWRSSLRSGDPGGLPLRLSGRVIDAGCRPMPGAVLDFWQADSSGRYDNRGFGLRGRLEADAHGRYVLQTIEPGVYPGRPPHIHVKVFDTGRREVLTTQIYFDRTGQGTFGRIRRPELIARDLEPAETGERHAGFDFVVAV